MVKSLIVKMTFRQMIYGCIKCNNHNNHHNNNNGIEIEYGKMDCISTFIPHFRCG